MYIKMQKWYNKKKIKYNHLVKPYVKKSGKTLAAECRARKKLNHDFETFMAMKNLASAGKMLNNIPCDWPGCDKKYSKPKHLK